MTSLVQEGERDTTGSTNTCELDLHIVLLTNFVSPHELPVLTELSRRVRKLTVLISTPMEEGRHWEPDWGNLEVHVQRNTTLTLPARHPLRFAESLQVHIPWNTISLLKGLHPDLVISEEMGFRTILSSLYGLAVPNVPLVIRTNQSEHTERGRGWVRHLVRKWLVRRADSITFNGPSGARYLRKIGCRPERMFCVPYASLPSTLDQVPYIRRPAEAHRLLYAGQLIERKGILPFVQALAKRGAAHPERKIEFTLAGSGPLRGAIEDCHMPRNVCMRLVGECTYDELVKWYRWAGILAFPSLCDEWGMVVNEAMAAGVPVLGSVYSQAVEDLCTDEVTGWTFRPDDTADMEQAIERCLSTSVDRLNEMRTAARKRVQHRTPEYVVDNLLQAVRFACQRSRH